ncbi:MAG: hypothetical protein V3V00_14850 [Saprospiraceae bacterium]
MVNGGIHSFGQAIALEIEIRVNVVSSGMVEDAYEKYRNYFPRHTPNPHEQSNHRICAKCKRQGKWRNH